MRLSWNEIRTRAQAFSKRWASAQYEKGETQSFYNDFFEIFGVKRRRVAITSERMRVEHLFSLYEGMVSPQYAKKPRRR